MDSTQNTSRQLGAMLWVSEREKTGASFLEMAEIEKLTIFLPGLVMTNIAMV